MGTPIECGQKRGNILYYSRAILDTLWSSYDRTIVSQLNGHPYCDHLFLLDGVRTFLLANSLWLADTFASRVWTKPINQHSFFCCFLVWRHRPKRLLRPATNSRSSYDTREGGGLKLRGEGECNASKAEINIMLYKVNTVCQSWEIAIKDDS